MIDVRAEIFGLWSAGNTVWNGAVKRARLYADLVKSLNHEQNWDDE